MGDYQKDLAIGKLEKATEMLGILTSRDSAWVAPEFQNDLRQVIELITKAKEHIVNV